MTVNEIRNNIRNNENLIEKVHSEKVSIENMISELEQLRTKFDILQTDFGSKQDSRQQGLSMFKQISIGNKIFSAYLSGMTDLLNGTEFNNAYDGLTVAKGKITTKIQELFQELSDCEGRIIYYQNRKNYWEEQLRLVQEQGEG